MHIILTALNLSASFHRNVLYNHTYLELIKRSYDTDYIFHNHTNVYSELKITFSEKNLLQTDCITSSLFNYNSAFIFLFR